MRDRINGSNSGTIAHYIDVLCQEICLTPARGTSLKTVFFGGGTPSLLAVEQLERILEILDQQFGIAIGAEISMEIDPGTFDQLQLEGYRKAGVNRVSLGVQAFQPELLQACGRSHTVPEVYQAIEQIHQAGFENFSLDLISGLPHQTLEHWQESLEKAIALVPTHLSCYDLTVEAGTPFSRQFKPGLAPLPSDEITADMYRMAQQTLTAAGYDHYEISNYARPGYQCQHNRVYWENRPFYGFGMGATSYLGGDRVSRPRKTQEYYGWVEERQKAEGRRQRAEEDAGTRGRGDAENLIQNSKLKTQNSKLKTQNSPPSPDLLLDTLMLGLRLAEGLNLAPLQAQFGEEIVKQILVCLQPYIQKGWVEITSDSGFGGLSPEAFPDKGQLRLTDPEGFLFSNVILVSLFDELG
ncbi:radical SAM family heme chaperone HemW [Kovacikia minuta CCNUW1]|nr:radical SAM family heme chaperone HemW [Kovacikia minuta]UBF29443.1 radical SAM family heme chaperone HemW [Kovacikia minuta CCNUW1]